MYRIVLVVWLMLLVATGCSSSSQSPQPPLPAQAPSDLETRLHGYGAIHLSWVDNGLHETSFHIERSIDGIDYMLVDSIAGDQQEYIDSGLSADQYYYRINASNQLGYTEYSNESEQVVWNVDACLDIPLSDPGDFSGQFFEMPISGLNYATPSHASFTDNGNFFFGTDSYSEFFIGYTPLGSVLNAPYVRYSDLAASMGAADYDDPIALNLLRLLQTIDSDADPFNGIQIPCELSTLPYREIDFTLDELGFADQPGMAELIGWKPMVSTLAASQRFSQLLNAYYAGTYSMEMIFFIDEVIPVSAQFSMTIGLDGELTMDIIEHAAASSFNAESGSFGVAYLNVEPFIAYFILTDVFGWDLGFTLEDLPQYYPYAFTVYGNIRPDHTLVGQSTLHTIGGNFYAPILGVRQ